MCITHQSIRENIRQEELGIYPLMIVELTWAPHDWSAKEEHEQLT